MLRAADHFASSSLSIAQAMDALLSANQDLTASTISVKGCDATGNKLHA
jgi:hypothetical protein